ncbi:MAG TPA: hypothetical protein VMS65_06750 [Polyangiaceae bacterium]|nr:hypothetical protein [Polyangiaceae bacterium]
MQGITIWSSSLLLMLAASCGGATPPPEAPPAIVEDPSEAPSPDKDKALSDEAYDEAPKEKPGASVPDPEFKENGSVDEAIKAVPQGTPRLNIETEALSKPLMDGKLYEPCKIGSGHFKVRVAVWNGKAVGIDLTTTPNSPKLAECIKGRIREVTWDDKVKSLNTVEYQF